MPNSLVPSPEIRPTVRWYYRNGDYLYRVYHSENGSAESCIWEGPPNPEEQVQELVVPDELNGVDGIWHQFRVEVLSSDLVESTRTLWHTLVRDQPEGPSNIEIEKELAGTFRITLTV